MSLEPGGTCSYSVMMHKPHGQRHSTPSLLPELELYTHPMASVMLFAFCDRRVLATANMHAACYAICTHTLDAIMLTYLSCALAWLPQNQGCRELVNITTNLLYEPSADNHSFIGGTTAPQRECIPSWRHLNTGNQGALLRFNKEIRWVVTESRSVLTSMLMHAKLK